MYLLRQWCKKGTQGNPPEELRALLTYLGDTRPINAVNGMLKELQEMVDTVKNDKEVSLSYMKVFEQEQKIREEVREEERVNTERERQRAEKAETRAENAETRLQLASKIIGAKRHHPEWTDQQLAEACGCTMEELDSF